MIKWSQQANLTCQYLVLVDFTTLVYIDNL